MPPKISIVTPSFNQARYVARTVRSVLLQDYPNVEYLFLDGGSSDGSMDQVAPYLDRFTYWRSERDGGQSAAVHEGLQRATGEVMGYLNSDDVLAPGALSTVMRFFDRHPQVDAVYSHRVFIDEHDTVKGAWILPPHSNYLISRWDFLPQETCFWRRRLFERAGNVDPSLSFAFDYELFVRYMRAGKFRRMNAFLAAFRWHSESKTFSQNYTVGVREVDLVQKRHAIRLWPHDAVVGAVFRRLPPRLGSVYVRIPGRKLLPFLGARGTDYNLVWEGKLTERA